MLTKSSLPRIRVNVPVKTKAKFVSHTVDINQARWMVKDLTEKIKEHEDKNLLSRLMTAFSFKGEK